MMLRSNLFRYYPLLVKNIHEVVTRSAGFATKTQYAVDRLSSEGATRKVIDETLLLSAFIDDLLKQPERNSLDDIPANFVSTNKSTLADNYWKSLQFPQDLGNDEQLPSSLISRFSKDLSGMNASMSVSLLLYLANQRIRHNQTLELLCKHIKGLCPLLNSYQVGLVVSSLNILNWPDAELITLMKRKFLSFRHDPYMSSITLQRVLFSFGHLHLTDRCFWRKIVEWMELIIGSKQIPKQQSLYICAQGLALANIDTRLTASISNALVNLLKRHYFEPRSWLEVVYMLACFNSLNNSSAESVLNSDFLSVIGEIQKHYEINRGKILYDSMRLKIISSAAKLDLTEYNGPFLAKKTVTKEDLHAVLQSIFPGNAMAGFTDFEVLLRIAAPLNLYSTGPEWNEETGVIIEGRCFVDSKRREFVPLSSAGEERRRGTECKQVAIVYFSDRQLTKIFDPEEEVGPVRLVGVCQTGIRLLKSAGLYPVVFTEQQFRELGSEQAKVEYIRERLFGLSDLFHENNWGSGPNEDLRKE